MASLKDFTFNKYTNAMYLGSVSKYWSLINKWRLSTTKGLIAPLKLRITNYMDIGSMDLYLPILFLLDNYFVRVKKFTAFDYYQMEKKGADKHQDAVKNLPIMKKKRLVKETELIDDNLETFKAKEEYDFITIQETLEHIPDEKAAIKSMYAATKQGSYVFVSVPIEMYFGVLFKELGRRIIIKQPEHTWKETFNAFFGRMSKVTPDPTGHRGYDYRQTVKRMKAQGYTLVKTKSYPFNIPYIDYGICFLFKKE